MAQLHAAHLQRLIQLLNDPPFEQRLTLHSFDNKHPSELINILYHVFCEVDSELPKTHKIMDDPDRGKTSNTLEQTVKMLNYKPYFKDPTGFMERLMRGEKSLHYPLMFWTTAKLPQLIERAHLAKYLNPMDIPDEFLVDPIIAQLIENYEEIKVKYKETHKKCRAKRFEGGNQDDLQNVRADVKQLSNEKEQLLTKLKRLEEKVARDSENNGISEDAFKRILDVTSGLRKVQEDEAELYDAKVVEIRNLQLAHKLRDQLEHKLRSLSQAINIRGEPHELLNALRRRCSDLRDRLENDLVQEIEATKDKLRESLMMIRSETIPEHEYDNLQEHKVRLDEELVRLQQQRDDLYVSQPEDLHFYRTQAEQKRRKKEEAQEQLEELIKEHQEVARDLAKVNMLVLEMKAESGGSRPPMNQMELKAYIRDLKAKTKTYEQMKNELQTVKGELFIAMRTEELLRAKDPNIAEFDAREAKRREELAGIDEARGKLAEMSAVKSELDQNKGNTLEDLAKIVKQINHSLNQKKHKLAPLLSELYKRRADFQELEKMHKEKKQAYDGTMIGYDSERQKFEDKVNEAQKAIGAAETRFHQINMLSKILEINFRKMEKEEACQSGEDRVSDEFQTYSQHVSQAIEDLQSEQTELRKQQREVKDDYGRGIEQKKYFSALNELMQVKLDEVKKLRKTEIKHEINDTGMGTETMVLHE